ncbi:MAG: hypothetical protein LKE79_01350 [Lachnospiraceae bacterium]|jgi:flagellar biosynthesis chaperone FliJ|nr:hypothetical protein [Lachnospiraceae bacterium]MCH4063272.1 hypothetical protein [Lachnospiraceae bacterium]MCH4105095.1 hypothetical protein [Lachnospiraceae bacterium]
MARKRSAESIDTEIAKVESEMSRLQERYDSLAEKLKSLQDQKRKLETDMLMEAYLNSGKSFDEVMTFLKL